MILRKSANVIQSRLDRLEKKAFKHIKNFYDGDIEYGPGNPSWDYNSKGMRILRRIWRTCDKYYKELGIPRY